MIETFCDKICNCILWLPGSWIQAPWRYRAWYCVSGLAYCHVLWPVYIYPLLIALIVHTGCEDIIVASLTVDNLVSVLNWSGEPHGSPWVLRQALHFLREEFLQIVNSPVLFELSKNHLLEALSSDFLQVRWHVCLTLDAVFTKHFLKYMYWTFRKINRLEVIFNGLVWKYWSDVVRKFVDCKACIQEYLTGLTEKVLYNYWIIVR